MKPIFLYGAVIALAACTLLLAQQKPTPKRINRAIELRPDMPEAHFNLGTALGVQGQRSEAKQQFLTALRLNPDYYEAHFNLAQTLAEEGNATEARPHYQRAAESPDPKLRQAALEALR